MTDTLPMDGCTRAFARHHGYPPRAGWLLKATTAALEFPDLFSRPDATVILGVGSSQVPAIRHWARAFGVLDEHRTDTSTLLAAPTARGTWLLDPQGADPYLEYPVTLWLLHWWLLSDRRCSAPTWHYLFGHAALSAYTRPHLRDAVRNAARASAWNPPSEDQVNRDIACIVAMYANTDHSADQPRSSVEEQLTNQFRELQLLESRPAEHPGRGTATELRLNRRAGSAAPAGVLAYACLDFAHRRSPGPGSISLGELTQHPCGPGRLLLADRDAVRRALTATARTHPDLPLDLTEIPGETILHFGHAPKTMADRVLAATYRCEGAPDDQL